MKQPKWIRTEAVIALHDRAIAEHGGIDGLRDLGLLESALHAPVNAWDYGQTELCALAAIYCSRIAKNHAFNDGNKRAALVTMLLFLRRNGRNVGASQEELYRITMDIANSTMTEEALASWLKERIASLE